MAALSHSQPRVPSAKIPNPLQYRLGTSVAKEGSGLTPAPLGEESAVKPVKSVPLPPIAGAVALAGGVVLARGTVTVK